MPSPLFKLPARYVNIAHTLVATTAFTGAFAIGSVGYYKQLCKNGVAGYPQEWFPSVSATIGDHLPPRIWFQIMIALCSGARFLLIFLQYLVHRTATPLGVDAGDKPQRTEGRARLLAAIGVLRTFTCGGWVYNTSTDHHDSHDFFMILYLVLTLPWMVLSISAATQAHVRGRRTQIATLFFATIVPMIYFFLRHTVQRIPGAYTYYSFFEWSLIIYDLAFDSVGASEVTRLQLQVVDLGKAAEHDATQNIAVLNPPFASSLVHNDGWEIKSAGSDWQGWRSPVAWLGDVFYAYAFWTVFTSLGLQLFYFSVWELVLLSSRFFAAFASSRQGQITLRSITLILGLGSYIIPGPGLRLIGVSFGTAAGWIALASGLGRLQGGRDAANEGATLGLGLVTAMFLKYANRSINPLWTVTNAASGGWNKTGLVIASAYIYEYATRPTSLHPAAPVGTSKKNDDLASSPARAKVLAQHRVPLAAGLGTLIFLLQMFVMDAGTIISWTRTGYTNGLPNGPTLHPYSGWVIFATCAGALSGTSSIPRSPLWSLVGIASAWAHYSFQNAVGFYAGLGFVFYLMSLIPLYFRAVSISPPAFTWGWAMGLNAILDVFSVVTAAYAFVPYGHLVRERTDLVLGFSALLLAAGAGAAETIITRHAPPIGVEHPTVSPRLRSATRYSTRYLLLLAGAALGTAFHLARKTSIPPTPYYPAESKVFSGGIFTVHFGLDIDARDSQYRMKQLIEEMQVDVLGLLETDLHRFVYGNRDLTRVIAEDLGYYVDLGPGPNSHTWGVALLSKFPIINSTHHLLPSPKGELAPAIFATLNVFGTHVNVMVSHNGQEEDLEDRTLQTTEIARLLREKGDEPAVFLGYLVTRTGDLRPWPYQILMEDGNMLDIEIGDRWRWCEYIAFRGLWRVGFARVHEGTITDNELQVGKFKLPDADRPAVYKDNKELYWHIGEEHIPAEWRFPSQFRGKGVRGHYYRVWNGPLYYWPPGYTNAR